MQITWTPQSLPDLVPYDAERPPWIDGRSFALLCPEIAAWQRAQRQYLAERAAARPGRRSRLHSQWQALSTVWAELRRQWAAACIGTGTRTSANK